MDFSEHYRTTFITPAQCLELGKQDQNWGTVQERIGFISYAFVFAGIWLCLRVFYKQLLGPSVARLCGIGSNRPTRTSKFSYQLWLLSYYSFSWGVGHWLYTGPDLQVSGCPYKIQRCRQLHVAYQQPLSPAALSPTMPPIPMLEAIEPCLGPMRDLVVTFASFMYDALTSTRPTFIHDFAEGASNATPPPVSSALMVFYLFQGGFYLSELIAILVEPKRTDFVVYMLHHLATLVLIFGSWAFGEEGMGLIVMWIHDLPDVLLAIAKLFVYVRQHLLAQVVFVLFAGSYFLFRVVGMPLLLVADWTLGCSVRQGYQLSALVLDLLLFFLLMPLHIYWFSLIVRMLCSRASEDPRSDDESDDESRQQRKRDMLGSIHRATENVLVSSADSPGLHAPLSRARGALTDTGAGVRRRTRR
eukprot:TRINITY_DN35406_c0_g1_i1.p1 TRINITY_DN35406_c0_g1~~TRINITY_DN35406_c0_g1_i1.p1  ORF type:complete len:416 (-),score=72.20 TRINITY_DN35406_c0_g1_i1:21-1268(-)